MKWHDGIYTGENSRRHRFSILRNIRNKKPMLGIYAIVLNIESGRLEILHNALLALKKDADRESIMLIGIAEGSREAFEIVRRITEEVYASDETLDMGRYFKEEACRQ